MRSFQAWLWVFVAVAWIKRNNSQISLYNHDNWRVSNTPFMMLCFPQHSSIWNGVWQEEMSFVNDVYWIQWCTHDINGRLSSTNSLRMAQLFWQALTWDDGWDPATWLSPNGVVITFRFLNIYSGELPVVLILLYRVCFRSWIKGKSAKTSKKDQLPNVRLILSCPSFLRSIISHLQETAEC